jgi:hypothetical protein
MRSIHMAARFPGLTIRSSRANERFKLVMATEVYPTPSYHFTVFQAKDGTTRWSGSYQRTKVTTSPIEGERC